MSVPSHRPLPDDPAIGALGEDARARIASSWRGRARNELSTSTVFATLTRTLVGLGAPHEIVREAALAVADEVRHAEICVHVARAYLPSCPFPEHSPVVEAPPLSGRPDHQLAGVLYVVMQSCINEGVATVYLQRSLAEATFVLARAAVRDILEDEIRHARFGWSLLAGETMRGPWRAGVGEALPTLLERVADAWISLYDAELAPVPAGHGTIDGDAMREVVRDAYEDLILPGFDRVGVDTRPARARLDRGSMVGSR
jgi:hypothetical protein